MIRRIIVVGGLAAGPSAAAKAARIDPRASVTLFELGEHVSYGICEIPYFVSGVVPREGLLPYSPVELEERKRITVKTLHRVEQILPSNRSVVVRDLRTGAVTNVPYDRLILATGSRPRALGVEGEDARNLFHVKSLDQGFAIRNYLEQEKPSRAVIIGGGYIGMEMADALRSSGMRVTLLHRQSLPMAGLERHVRERVRKELEQNGVEFIVHAETEGFVLDTSRRITHVVTSSGTYEADLVILSIGVEPNSELARDAGIRVGRFSGILTDQRQMTNMDNILAAGDCCEVKSLVHNSSVYLPLATVASKAGWVAGENAAGGKAIFRGAIRAIAVQIFGLEVAHVGLGAEEAVSAGFDVVTETVTAWSKVSVMPGSRKMNITVIADRRSGRLLGANLYGEQGVVLRANTLAVAIQEKIPLNDIQGWDLAYSPPFAPLWDPILVAVNALRKKL